MSWPTEYARHLDVRTTSIYPLPKMSPDRALAVVARAGSIDISFNLITRGDVHEIPLVDMEVADFVRPVTTGITTAAHLE
jgi:hypothetical protein